MVIRGDLAAMKIFAESEQGVRSRLAIRVQNTMSYCGA